MPASPDTHHTLSLLLQGLSGNALQVQATPPRSGDSAAPRPILAPTHLLLPAGLDAAQQRAAVAHAAAHLLHSPAAQPSSTLKPLSQAVVAALEDARVELLLSQQLPGVRAWFLQELRAGVRPHDLDFTAWISRLSLALLDDGYQDGSHWVDKGRTLFALTRAQYGLGHYEAYRRVASVLANDLGQMRVRFEPGQYAVPAAYRDDNSYLWNHGAAKDAEEEPLTLQTPPPANTHGERRVDPADAPAATLLHLYPEWNHRNAVLRPDWCTVIETVAASEQGSHALPPAVRLPLPQRRRAGGGRRLRRQWEGEELDLDAAIDVQVNQRLRLATEPRVFQRAVQPPQHLSLLLLLDLSQSTAAPAADGSGTLLALEQRAALLLAEAARAAGDRIAIHGFCSDTRQRVHYEHLLDFDAPLDAQAAARVHGAPARWSTRLGAAVRHATRLLAAETTPQRALVVLTDGAPADIDVHDEHYLVEDARAAVREARHAGLQVHGLSVDAGAAPYARRIFGPGHFRVLGRAAQLPHQLAHAYARLTLR